MRGYVRALEHQVDEPVRYSLRLGEEEADLNEWLGRHVQITFLGEKRCIVCQRKVNKLYQNGYCFPCVTTLAETDLCIVKPHECHFHLGTCRDEQFAERHCMIPHYVYLGVSSQAKVGLTRKNREWTRWIDQGAVRAMLLAEVPTRKGAGELEMEIAAHIPDKTDWRKLVLGVTSDVDLYALAEEVSSRLSEQWQKYLFTEKSVHSFVYPVIPDKTTKAKSYSLDKLNQIEGELIGIRGQYLLFEHGVFQVKKHAGMLCDISVE